MHFQKIFFYAVSKDIWCNFEIFVGASEVEGDPPGGEHDLKRNCLKQFKRICWCKEIHQAKNITYHYCGANERQFCMQCFVPFQKNFDAIKKEMLDGI